MSGGPLRLAEATPAQIEARLATCPALILPIGTVEYHGAHLPLGLDGLKSELIAEAAATASGAVLAPTSWWAADGVTRPFTLRLQASVVEPLLVEALVQFSRMGFLAIALANGHFGLENSRLLRRAALSAMERTDTSVMPVADYEVLLDLGNDGDHAGHWETSLLLGARPELVHLDAIPDGDEVDGVIGADPRSANAEDGSVGIARAGRSIADSVGRALAFSPGERAGYVGALVAALAALDRIAELRLSLPREQVPPPLTPAWRAHLEAMERGDWDAARAAAEAKRDEPGA